jgi:hypothetical protein
MTVTKTGVIGQTTCQANSSTYDRDATGAAPGTFDTDAPCNFKLGFNGGSDLAIALSASDTMPVHAVVDEINEALLADLVYFKYYGCCTYTGMGGGDAVRITHPEGGVANYFTLTDGTANSCLNVIFTAAAGPYTCTGVDVYLDPYLPTATDQGEPIACKKGYLRMRDGVQFPVKSAQIVINNNLEWMDDEKNDSDYSSGKLDGSRREISLTMKMYWREKYAKAFGQAINFEDNSLFFEVGSQNYSIWAGCVPSFKLQVPKPGNTESGKELDLEGIVYGDNARWGSTTYDNEFVLGAF